MFNKKFETWCRVWLLRFCVSHKIQLHGLKVTFYSSIACHPCPERKKKLNMKRVGTHTHCESNGLVPERDRILYIYVGIIFLYIFPCLLYTFPSPVLSLHTTKCFSSFLQFWELLHGHENFGIIWQYLCHSHKKGSSSPNLLISFSIVKHVIHLNDTQIQFIRSLYICQGRGWSLLGGLFSLEYIPHFSTESFQHVSFVVSLEVIQTKKIWPEEKIVKFWTILDKLAQKLFSCLSYLCSGAAIVPPSYLFV